MCSHHRLLSKNKNKGKTVLLSDIDIERLSTDVEIEELDDSGSVIISGSLGFVSTLWSLDKEEIDFLFSLEPNVVVQFAVKKFSRIARIRRSDKPLVYPFLRDSVSQDEKGRKIPSYGSSSYGYDMRLSNSFRLITAAEGNTKTIDIFDFQDKTNSRLLTDVESIVLYPHQLVLGVSEEHFNLPNNVTGICMAKSTWARMGIEATVTPLEAGWSGHVTIELINKNEFPIRIYPGVGIMQVQFFQGSSTCRVSYADRKGKYQHQPKLPVSAKL
jgi:dCTP deaminase